MPGYKPRDLFNAGRDRAYTVPSESPTKERCSVRQRSKSFALKVKYKLGNEYVLLTEFKVHTVS